MSLTQVGGAGDGGVDLRGWWTIPKLGSTSMSEGRRLRVLGQCKAERKALGPRIVRELEGVMAHQRGAPIHLNAMNWELILDPEVPDALAILLSQSGFSPKAMIHATRSSTPLLLVHLPGGRLPSSPIEEEGGGIEVEGAIWNSALGGPTGLLGGGMELRREILDHSGVDGITGDSKVKARVGIWYNGKRFTGMPQV
jgi:hypothetical protein